MVLKREHDKQRAKIELAELGDRTNQVRGPSSEVRGPVRTEPGPRSIHVLLVFVPSKLYYFYDFYLFAPSTLGQKKVKRRWYTKYVLS